MSFADFLTQSKYVEARSINRAIAAYESSDAQSFGQVVLDLGLIAKDDLYKAYQQYFELDSYNKEVYEFAQDFQLSEAFLRQYLLFPIVDKGQLKIILTDPTNDYVREALLFSLGEEPGYILGLEEEVKNLLDEEFGIQTLDEIGNGHHAGDDLARLEELASDAPVIRYLDGLIDDAVGRGASDIHIEPLDAGISVRFRIDGKLILAQPPELTWALAVLSRIKILAGLDIAEKRLPQDGRLKQMVRGREFDFRVATSPTLHGETIVLRLLDRMTVPGSLQELGFGEDEASRIYQAASSSEGIVLVTGPTGSGKTTTLYSLLDHLNQEDVKILTVEDPVEYRLSGINQVQVDSKIGRTFAASLRSFLRQDPDIIMVGEIRDTETAEIAFRAAETGHLVLSTLHTNDAASAITRLKDMGLKGFLMAGPLRAIIAQRLVRKLCDHCKEERELDAVEQSQYDCDVAYTPVGCEHCNQTGFNSRTVISEVIIINDEIRDLIKVDSDAKSIARLAEKQGRKSLSESVKFLIKKGDVSPFLSECY